MATKFPVRENTGNLEILPKHRENTGILFAQVVNSLILKVKDIICHENSNFFQKLYRSAKSVLCNSRKLCQLAQGKFAVGQGKNRENVQGIRKYNLSGYPAPIFSLVKKSYL